MKLESLRVLGLSDGEIKVYSAVLDLGISTLNGIQEKTGIERRNIYDILNKLIDKGMISYNVENKHKTYQCTPPNKILDEVQKRENALQDIREKIPEIESIFNVARPDITAQTYRGEGGAKTLFLEMLNYEESYWIGGNNMEGGRYVSKSMHMYFDKWMKMRAEKKHMMYDLISEGGHLKDYEPGKIDFHKENYYKLNILPKGMYMPLVIIMFGNKVAQVVWSEQPFIFVIESEQVKKSFMNYFNYFWKDPW